MTVQSSTQAAQLHLGWNYALDAPNDSLGLGPTGRRQAGDTIYEIYGLAVKDDPATNSVWFGISAKLPLYGNNTGPQLCPVGDIRCYEVADSNIGWGDLFLDFSGTGNLRAASDSGQLMGIRFAPRNDSRVAGSGVYENVRITSVTIENAGYSNLANNNNMVQNLTGGSRSASMGDLAWNNPYFAPYTTPGSYTDPASLMPNVLASGNKIGEVTLLGRDDLIRAGLDPNFFQADGAEIFGFRLPKALLPAGEFVATLLTECVNDGVALVSQLVAPPPPPPPPPPRSICTVTEGQRNALLPDEIINGVKIFRDAPSGRWFDPPANMGFQFVAIGDTLFTSIDGFPCALVPPEETEIRPAPFNVLVRNEQNEYQLLGQYFPGQRVDFVSLLGGGISEFVVTGIDPDAWEPLLPENPPAIAFPLSFTGNGDFALRKIEDTTKLPIDPTEPTLGGPILPEIIGLPPVIGPELSPPCSDGRSDCNSAAVPEPSTMAGIGLAIASGIGLRRRKQNQQNSKS